MTITPDMVAQHYDQWTPAYLAAFGSCIQANRPTGDEEFLAYLMDRIGLGPGSRALDAGCGICGPARFFAAHSGAKIEALTISAVQAEIASKSNRQAGLDDKINIKVGDFHLLDKLYEADSFDCLYFLESLSHSGDPFRVLNSAYQVLKPGGVIYIKDFFGLRCEDPAMQSEVLAIIRRVNQAFKVETPWAVDILQSLDKVGFQKLFVENPQFVPDISKWQAFETAHNFGLYKDGVPLNWTEWLEMKFQKP